MSVTFELKQQFILSDEVQSKLNSFFLNGETSPKFDVTSRGSSLDSEDRFLDSDKPAGAEDWNPLLNDERTEADNEAYQSALLSSCILSTYSSLEYMSIARGEKLAMLARLSGDEHKLGIVFMRSVASDICMEDEEYVSASCLFGLGSFRHTEVLDCLIISIGTSKGRVAFFTEKGTLLFLESFGSDVSILSITFDQCEDGQFFTVTTPEDVFLVNPLSLHSNLLQAKSAIARKEKTAVELSEQLELEVKRFGLEGRARLLHVVFTGLEKPSPFQQYVSASIDNFNQKVEGPSSSYSTFFVNSTQMFGTFVWQREGVDDSSLYETVSKITTSFVPHFGFRKFLGIEQAPEKKKAVNYPRRIAVARGVLNDARKVAIISKAPAHRPLLAVVDETARVLLIDVKQRQIVRIWKSYRDASVAWITASHEGRQALFLAVFAPRRSLIEVWSIQSGGRVGAQHVDPAGLLLDGGSASIICGIRESSEEARAFFINSEGCVFEVVVPFSLALMKTTSHDEHDQIILNRMPSTADDLTSECFLKLYSTLCSLRGRRQALLSLWARIVDAESFSIILDTLQKEEDNSSPVELIEMMKKYLTMYNKLTSISSPAINQELMFPFHEETNTWIKFHLKLGTWYEKRDHNIREFLSCIDLQSEKDTSFDLTIASTKILDFCNLVFFPVLTGQMDVSLFLNDIVRPLPFSEATLCHLLSCFILNSDWTMDKCFGNLCTLLSVFGQQDRSLLTAVEKSALESVSSSRSLLLYVSVCMAKKIIEQNTDVKDSENTDDGNDWEAFDPSTEYLDSAIQILHANYLASQFQSGVTYTRILTNGSGLFRETLAAWVVAQHLDPDQLQSEIGANESLQQLMTLLPHTFTWDLVSADCSWELSSHWFKNKEQSFPMLQLAIEYVSRIENARLKHGVARLIWDKFLQPMLEVLSAIIEKKGRPPKERESLQSLQLSGTCLCQFLDNCSAVLSCLLDSVRDAPPHTTFPVDHLLQIAVSHPPSSLVASGAMRDSLVHIATRQSLVNYHLVQHYSQLVTVYRLQISLSMRLRPLSTLFCAVGRRAFFHGLDTYPLLPEQVDDSIMEQRHSFLNKVTEEGTDQERPIARNLAHSWALTVESIALMQVLSHLRNGDDESASRELSALSSSQLGMRMAKILAARTLKLAAEDGTVLTSIHKRYLTDVASDELDRVNCVGNWRQSVQSLGRIATAIEMPFDATTSFVTISTITVQYWGIQCYK